METKNRILTLAALIGSALVIPAQAEFGTGADAQVSIGPSAALLNEKWGFGGTIDVLFRPAKDVPLYVGVESGLLHWQSGGTTGIFTRVATHNSVPVLATAIYRLELSDTIVQPYLGIAAGISISFVGATLGAGDAVINPSETNLYFEGLVKPGVQLGAFFIEPKFGIFDGNFIFVPTIGVTFGI